MKIIAADTVSDDVVARIRREGERVLTVLEGVHADIELGRIEDARAGVATLLARLREQNGLVDGLLEAIVLDPTGDDASRVR